METSIEPGPQSFLLEYSQDSSYFIISGLVLLVLLGLSALISGSEVAFFSLSGVQLTECSESKLSSEKGIYRLLQKPRKLLATILIINNLVNVAFVMISTLMIWEFSGTKDPRNTFNLITPFVVTFLIVFVGEVVPKIFANQNNLKFARATVGLLSVTDKLFTPLSWVLLRSSKVIESRVEKKGFDVSVKDLHDAIELATTDQQETTEEEKEILKGIVNFSQISVTQIMVARIDVTAIENTIDFHQLMDKVNKCGLSRIPVYNDTIDSIEGVLYVKDLLPYINKDETFNWQELIRETYFVPESKKIDDLLRNFQEKHVHMAIVVDEYGGTSGLVTLEDVIEQIVGEINDEFDQDDVDFVKVDETTYVFEGKTSLTDIIKTLDLEPDVFDDSKGESESIGGLLLELNSSMPRVGDILVLKEFKFIVEAVNEKRIKRIRVEFGEKEIPEFED